MTFYSIRNRVICINQHYQLWRKRSSLCRHWSDQPKSY